MEYNNALYHHGIKGMKWGVRRYQNKDGSLTPAGQKRRARLEGELEKLGGQKKSSESGSEGAVRKKSISEMSNKELQEYTTRMQLEKNYYDAQRNLASAMPPKQVSKGQKMAEKLVNEVLLPSAMNAGKSYLDAALKKAIGGDSEDTLAALKKTYEKLDYQQKIDKIKHPDKYLSEEDKNKRQQREFDAEDRAAKKEGYQNAADKAYKQSEERKAAAESARKDTADESARAANETKSEEYYNAQYRNQGIGREEAGAKTERGLAIYNSPNTGLAKQVRDWTKSTVDNQKDSTVTSLSTSVINKGRDNVDKYLEFELYDTDGSSLRNYSSDDDVSYHN